MTFESVAKQHAEQVPSVFVLFDAQIGPAHVLVPADATVEYISSFIRSARVAPCHALSVWINDYFVGWHCGDRTGKVVKFQRERDALALADVRNAFWAARSSTQEVA